MVVPAVVVLGSSMALLAPRVFIHIEGLLRFVTDVIGNSSVDFQHMDGQINNLIPLIKFKEYVMNYDIWAVLFGSGLGTSAFINSSPKLYFEIGYPHCNSSEHCMKLASLAFSSLCCFCKCEMGRISSQKSLYVSLPWIYLMVLCTYLAHRNDGFLIFFGILIAVCNLRWLPDKPALENSTGPAK